MISIKDFEGDGNRWVMASEVGKRLYCRVSYKYGKCSYEVGVNGEIVARTYNLQEAIEIFNKV